MRKHKIKFIFLDILITILSLYILGESIYTISFPQILPETLKLLNIIENIICGVFLVDFCVRFYYAENKWRYMRWGWIDLISSIPIVNYVQLLRVYRIIRIIRIIKSFKSIRQIVDDIFKNKTNGIFTSVIITVIIILIFSTIAILQVETTPDSNIKTAGDAIWWAYTTITTVGYGDKYPLTLEGRILAGILMTAGIGLFGIFSGFVVSLFVSEHEKVGSVADEIIKFKKLMDDGVISPDEFQIQKTRLLK